jgi:CSLREA domain-containing protein
MFHARSASTLIVFRTLRKLAPLAISLTVLLPATAQAAQFVVNSTADAVDLAPGDGTCATSTGVCTLRAAIQEANALTGGPHTIRLPPGTYALTIPGAGEDKGATGDLNITANLTISGAGATGTIIAGAALDRVLHVVKGTVIIYGVSITRGDASKDKRGGGGILNNGTLTLNDSVVHGNKGSGGGIFNTGTLTINNSTIRDNDGGTGVGGIYNSFGTLTLNNSTVSGNSAMGVGGIRSSAGTMTINSSTIVANTATQNIAGGILNDCNGGGAATDRIVATATLINSTVHGNSAATYGGGIVNQSANLTGCNGATIILVNTTVSGNTAGGDGGGIIQDPGNNNPGTIILKNSILAGNTGNPGANCSGTISSLGHNIIDDASCALAGVGDRNGRDPMLGPFTKNGGPTETRAPLLGSVAIDAVPLADCTDANAVPIATDQRGVTRPQGAACDIGAVDVKPQLWVLVLGLAGGHGESIATPPKLFPTQDDCRTAGQAWVNKVGTLPNQPDNWDGGRGPATFLCFQIANN